MAVTFDELLERARKRVAEVSPARQGIPTSPAVPELHRTQFRGRPVEVPLRPDSGVDVDSAIARASEAVQRLDRPLRTLGVGGGQPTSPEDRPKPDVAGFLASIARPEAVVELEDQGFLERSGRSILASFGRIGSGLVRGLDEIVQAFETVYLGRHTEPGEYRYLTELANAMADPRTYGYTPTPVWDNLKTDLSEGRLWDAAKTLASGGVELAIASIPDMIFLLAAPLRAPYIASLTTQYATERMEREGRSELTWSDIAVGAATAVIVTQLEKLGAERALGVIERDGITTFVRRMWDAIRTEGLTEAGQSAVENLLVRAPSGQGITPGQFFEDILESAVLGGAAGGAMRLPSATFRAIVPPAQPQEEPPPPEAPEEDEPPTGPAPEVMEALRREFGQPPTPPPAAGPAPATPTPGQPPAAPPTTPEATPAQGPARVPTTITRRMREQLVDLGYTTEDIRQMTPQGAWEIITEGRQKAASAEDEELDEQMPRAIPEGMPEQEERTPTPAEDEELDEQMPRAIPEGMPEQEERTPTPAAPQRPAEPETRIEFRDLDELAKSDEGLEAMRALVNRLRSQARDESESTVLRLGALRLQSERVRDRLLEPMNQIFSRLPLEERVAITNALRSGDAAGLQAAVGQSVAPAKRTVPEVGTAPTPENLLAHYNSIEAAPAGRRFAAKLPDRIGNLLPLAQSVRSLPGLPEQDVATLNQVIAQLTRWMSAPPEKVRKGAVTTHKKVDQVSRTIKEILESLEHEYVPTGPSGRVQQIQVRKKPRAEPAALPPPAGPPVIESKKKVEPQKAQEEPWWAKEPQPEPGQKPNEELRERIYKAYTELVAEVGHDSPLIHQLHQKVGGDLDALKRELLLMGREGLAIPGRGDWSLSTPEERRAAIFLRNRVLQADINPATGEISEGAGKHTRIKIKVPERGTTPPPPHPEWATKHETDVAGKIVYSDDEVALLEGFSVMTGEPIYAFVSKAADSRSTVDVEAYTGNALTSEQRERLIAAKRAVMAEDAARHAERPDGPFKGGARFAASEGVPSELASVAREWLDMLGIKARVFLTTVDDVRADDARAKYGLYGPYAAVRSASVDSGGNGSTRRLSNGDHYIVLNIRPRKSRNLEALAHEIGHILEKEEWGNADASTREAVVNAYKRWVESTKGKKAIEVVRALRAHVTGKQEWLPDSMSGDDLGPYWTSFSEWFADQVSRWAVSERRPLTVVEKFFARLAEGLRRLYASVAGKKSLPTEEMRAYLNSRVLTPSPLDGDTGKAQGSHPQTAAQREIIKVKPKPVRGRQAESLLNMLGMQIEPGQGRRALEQLKTVLPGLNTKTGRVFALVPSRDAKGQLKAGAIPIPAAEKLRDLVYAHVRSGNPAITLQNLKDFLDDIGEGKALDPETQTEVLDFAEQLRSLRQRRLAEEAEPEEETEEERRLREIREETEQTLEDEDILRQDVQTGAIELDPEDVDFIEGPAPQPGQKGIGVREAKAFADRLTQRWANMPARLIVTTRRDMAGMPDNLRELLERRDPQRTARGMHVKQLNAVWIFADNIPDLKQLKRTIVHEILGHYAAYEYFGDSYRMVADFMLQTFPDKAREIARLYRQDLRTRKGRDIVGNEIIAFIATELEAGTATQRMRNAWERFLLWLNRQLQRLFGASFNLSDLEARDLVRQSVRWARRGRGVPVGAMATGQSAALDLQQAYHGSPYEDIDRFSTEYIGTGEGAQAYGWGLYFTSKKEIAEFYRRKLSTDLVPSEDVLAEYFKPGRIVRGYSGYDRVIEFHPSVPGEREWYVTVQAVRQDESGNWVNDPTYPRPRNHRTLPEPKELERVLGKLPKRGRVYRVDIPENDELMDWDAAFEDQPQAIQDALNRMVAERFPEKVDSLIKPWRTGEHIYSLLVDHFHGERARREFYGNEQEAVSRLLAEYGIKGHTYMGETSGERNFVIYDDRVIEILDAGLHIPEDEQGRPAPRVISGSGEADSGDMTFAEMTAPKRWQPPPSLSQITRLRVLDPTDLGMFGAVAEEANFGDLVSRAEANAGSPVKAGDLLTAVSNAALRVARQQSRYSNGAYRLAAIARNLAKMAADVPVYFRNVPWHDPSGVYIEGGLERPLDAEIRMRFGDDIKHGVTLTYGQAGPESPAALMFALMHEVGHAATIFEIRRNPNSPAVQELTQLYERLKNMVQLEHAPWWGTPEEQLLFYNHNAWNSVAEFTTEVMTNPQFLRDLSRYDEIYRQKYEPNKTIFGKFVSVITRLLGLSPEHEQLVLLVTDAAWSVATLQQRNPQAQEYFRRLASMSRARELPNVAAPMLSELGDAEFEARIAEFGGPATAALARHGSLASRDFASGLFGAMRKAFLALHTMDQIERRHADAFEGAAGGGNALKDLVATYRRRRAISTKLQEDAEKSFSRQWLTLGAQESARLGEVMRDSTLFQIDPTKGELEQAPEAIKRAGFERQYRKIKAAYDALTPEAKKVYNQARDYFARMRKETRRAATDLVLDSYADAARTQPTAETRRKVAEVRSLKQLDSLIGAGMPLDYGDQNAAVRRALWKVVKLTDISGPYFPLRRYGEYVVSAKEDVDETYATEAEARAALERIEDEAPANDVVVSEENGVWKVTGARYDFSLHETQAEAEREKEALAKRGIESYIGMKLDANPLGGNESAIAALMEAVNRRLAGEPEARKLVEMAFIEVMADRATYASRLRREGYSGVKGEEMRRAVAERAVGSAWNIADMRTVLAESNALKRLRKAAVDQSVDDATRIRRGLVVNELTRSRARMIEDRSTSPLNRIISNFGYIRFLADPAYAFVNLTQTPAVAYPVIAARYGYGRTFAAMRRAYRAVTSPTIVNAIRGYARRPGDVTQYDLLSATMKALEAHPTYKKYVPALQKLIDNDVIDATFTQELLSAARGGALGHSQWQRLLEYSKLLPQGTEFLNRFVTAITVLELTGGNVEKAADMVRLTQFDYTAENRPRAFRFPGARAILMFKMYAQGIGNLLVSSFYDSIRRHSGRTEALRTLAGLIGTHSLAAGVLGGVMLEPLRWIINSVLWAVTDDEEQTPSIDTLVSNWAADVFGQKAGEIIARGVPMAVGLDMSRMSLANLIFHDRGQDWLSPEGLVSLLGPLPQVAFDAKRGVEDLQEGRYERAAARLIPVKVIADFARALELKTRGITTGAGATRIPPEEVSAFEVALTGLGFTPRRVRLDVERRRVEAERQEFLSETRGSLLRRWRQARSTAERRRIIEDVRRFNRANPSNRIRMQDLIRSQREEQRALRRSLTGRHQDRTLREQLRFLE